ncbi:hypothetical protein HPB48_018242 [Haemaphysalis longicornis]|uniref:Uncharacterized protein n=1 Tax=Haemaphysalis longicornis TaxID=44386 RepID=A0A9J6FD24_HAELO|nr:hypothetical protein HPB48_018242 [Haemaphysalis longicornis]
MERRRRRRSDRLVCLNRLRILSLRTCCIKPTATTACSVIIRSTWSPPAQVSTLGEPVFLHHEGGSQCLPALGLTLPLHRLCPLAADPPMTMPTPDDTERWRTVYRSRRRSAELQTVVFRPSNLSLKACKPIAISQAIAAAAHLTPSELQDTLLQPQPDKNTFRMSALTKLRGLQSLRIQDTDIPLCAYLAAPTDSCRGVIHGVQANTPPEELAANLISTGASIIAARMMGRTETALITFAGSTNPRYVIYHHTEFRCYPQKPKAQFCSRCHNIGHRVDVCPLPPSTVLCTTCSRDITGLAADQEHDCVPKCHLCQGAHASTSPKCPTRMDADAQSARRAYQRPLANRRSQRPALDMTSSDPQDRRHRSSSRRRQRSQSQHRQRPQSQQRHASRFQSQKPGLHHLIAASPHPNMFDFACQAILKHNRGR